VPRRPDSPTMKPIIGIPCAMQEPQDEFDIGASAMSQSYLNALEAVGAAPLLIPITGQESTLRALYWHLDGLLLTGGADLDPALFDEPPHPKLGKVDAQRDWVELTLTRWALADEMPLLGICRGIQTLNVACGGTLWQDISAQVPDAIPHTFYPGHPFNLLAHSVQIEPGSRLAEALGALEMEVNSLHHQAVKEAGAGLHITGRAPDGLIEGLEGNGEAWVAAVQWHPEWLLDDDPRMKQLFATFAAACTNPPQIT
jgi:putative glutamine amidotransferase